MRVPLSWLREYVDFDLSVEELVRVITLHSQEIDGIYRYGVPDGEVVVGELLTFDKHPDADKLSVSKVDVGGSEVQIVTGAANPSAGSRVPIILPGSRLADGTKLKKSKLRGIESYGMMMSERELGISGEHGGILLLDDTFEVGKPVSDYFPINETVLDIDVTPNRPDLWGIIGVARELAAILGTNFRVPELTFETDGQQTSDFTLRVEDTGLCPRYDLRRVSGVDPSRKTPLWAKRWIFAAGMRPINAVVDASNFTMLETGQPNHAFDASKVRDGIVVRRANAGEKMKMLDGSTRSLDGDMLVIADEQRGLVVAGVMGAEDAEVSETTTDILMEVATFDGRSIMGTSSRLGLRTDASGRNERGLDPEMVDFARDRVTSLITQFAGGSIAPDVLSSYPNPVGPATVEMRLQRAEALLGTSVTRDEAAGYLTALGCGVGGDDTLSVEVPTFRRDLTREVDLIEEVGRLVGLDRIPELLPPTSVTGGLTQDQSRNRDLRRLLADLGLFEAMLYPFGPRRWNEDLGISGEPVTLANPLSGDMVALRSTLLPGLLEAAARSRAFGERGGGIFEVGRTFAREDIPNPEASIRFRMEGELSDGTSERNLTGVSERGRVAVLLVGDVRPASWNTPSLEAGFFSAKGISDRLVRGATYEPAATPFLHPGRSATVHLDGKEVGWVGEVHPAVAEKFELEGWRVAALELDLTSCSPDIEPRFEAFQNIPAISRDLAVVVDGDVSAGDLLSSVRAAGGRLLRDSNVFDVYEGEQVPEGKKSVALSFVFRGDETLTDEVVDASMSDISAALAENHAAEVRS